MNVSDALPKRIRPQAKELLCKISYAETREECERFRDQFSKGFERDYGNVVKKLHNDWERMLTFYSFPKEQWIHLRTTNIVGSPFNAIHLRTNVVRRYKKVELATAMIWKLLQVAEKNFRTLKEYWLLPDVRKPFRPSSGESSLFPGYTVRARFLN